MSLAIPVETFEVVTDGKTGTLGRCAGLARHVVLMTWRFAALFASPQSSNVQARLICT